MQTHDVDDRLITGYGKMMGQFKIKLEFHNPNLRLGATVQSGWSHASTTLAHVKSFPSYLSLMQHFSH